jgi:hypothetical protein
MNRIYFEFKMFGNQSHPNSVSTASNIYYEEKLREAFIEAADNREQIIYNEESWMYLMAHLTRTKLVSMRDSETLERFRPSFPLNFETFINTIGQAFGDQSLKQLDLQFDEAQEQLNNCRTFINMMNINLLHRNELK